MDAPPAEPSVPSFPVPFMEAPQAATRAKANDRKQFSYVFIRCLLRQTRMTLEKMNGAYAVKIAMTISEEIWQFA